MDFKEFEAFARETFHSIPPQFREGIDGLEVSRGTVPHPRFDDVYTLGECLTEEYPTGFGGAGEVRSVVVLYYGSFLALSRTADEWDWEEEIFETVTHEVRHHLESLASDDTLEEMDYAVEQNFARRHGSVMNRDSDVSHELQHPHEAHADDALEEFGYAADQNFARREGETFDPYFYRAGVALGDRTWEVDGDVFVEVSVGRGTQAGESLSVEWGGRSYSVPGTGEDVADVHFVRVAERVDRQGDVYAVLLRERGVLGWVAALFGSSFAVRETDLVTGSDKGDEP